MIKQSGKKNRRAPRVTNAEKSSNHKSDDADAHLGTDALPENMTILKDGKVLLRINKDIYPQYNVLGAVADFSDNFQTTLDADDKYYLVIIKPKKQTLSKKELIAVGLEFFNYLIDLGSVGLARKL